MKKISLAVLVPILALAIFLMGRKLYFQPRYVNGEKAPAFTGQTLDGQAFSLESLQGNYVLLDFWGSWCGPCRAEVPQLKALHAEYGNKALADGSKLVLVSVAVERQEAAWRKAVEQLGLSWEYHLLDLASSLKFFNSEIASLYGVKEVPTKFLLNPRGEIIGVNPSFDEIRTMMERAR